MLKVLVVLLVLALVTYGAVRLLQSRTSGPAPRVTGPDDDPDFLRGLDRRPDDD
jgi:hypothetical protein